LDLKRSAFRFLCFNLWLIHYLILGFALKVTTGSWNIEGDEVAAVFSAGFVLVIAFVVITLVSTISFAMAGFRRDRRALHDLLSGTRVYYKMNVDERR